MPGEDPWSDGQDPWSHLMRESCLETHVDAGLASAKGPGPESAGADGFEIQGNEKRASWQPVVPVHTIKPFWASQTPTQAQ